jgi:hypothetical protein
VNLFISVTVSSPIRKFWDSSKMRSGQDVEGEEYMRPTALPAFDSAIRRLVSDQSVTLLTGVSAVLVAIVMLILFSTQSAPAVIGDASTASLKAVVPVGVQENIDLQQIMHIEGCWRVCYKQPFNDFTPSVESLQSRCAGDWVFMGALPLAENAGNTFKVGAFGEKRVVFETLSSLKSEKSTTVKGVSNNGVYWYGTREVSGKQTVPRSIGFSSSEYLELSAEDDTGFSTTCTDRLSFSFDTPDHKSKTTGAADCKSFKRTDTTGPKDYHKVIMSNTCDVRQLV